MKNRTSCHLSLYRHIIHTLPPLCVYAEHRNYQLKKNTLSSRHSLCWCPRSWHAQIQSCTLIKDSGGADGIHARLGSSCNYSRHVRETRHRRRRPNQTGGCHGHRLDEQRLTNNVLMQGQEEQTPLLWTGYDPLTRVSSGFRAQRLRPLQQRLCRHRVTSPRPYEPTALHHVKGLSCW